VLSESRSNDRAKDGPTLPQFCLDVLGVLALAGLQEFTVLDGGRVREGVVALEGIDATWLIGVSRRSVVVLGDNDDNSVDVNFGAECVLFKLLTRHTAPFIITLAMYSSA
jgi:hypothetical protein